METFAAALVGSNMRDIVLHVFVNDLNTKFEAGTAANTNRKAYF